MIDLSLLGLIVILVIVGLVMWLVNTYLPIEEPYKKIINVIVLVCTVIYVIAWLLRFAGISAGIPF